MVTINSANEPTAATGKVLQSSGVGVTPAFSTATYPSTATGTGKILRADGTNWAATTATYPDTAGTSGNVLTSDGTNWTSAAPSSGSGATYGFRVISGDPADGGVYYFMGGDTFTGNTTYASWLGFTMATSGTINKCYGVFTIAGTLGSNQNCTMALRKNNTTDTTVSSAIQLTATDVNFSGTSLGISVTAGDIIAFKFTSPTWTTNPTTVRVSATFSVE